jgi:hypothetical protein
MFRRSFALIAFALLLLPVVPAGAQQVPTLMLGSAATIHLIPPGEVGADGKKISLTVLVTDETGGLANGVRFRGTAASAGRIDQDCPQVGPGLYNCGYITPTRASTGEELRFRARLASGSEIQASFPINVVAKARARITFNATPAEIVLTVDPSSAITFNVTDEAGNVMEGLDLRATANVGQVQAVTAKGGGTYTALYVPPATPFPQVALISVWDANRPGNVFGFFRISLVGNVNYPVDARAAGVSLIFTVGDRTFPPVVSDSNGRASVPILVPPGVSYAQVELIQPNGARSTQQIDLQPPAFNRIALGGVPVFLPANGEKQARIRVFTVDPKGRPADGQDIVLTASQGQIGAARFIGNGTYEAIYTAPWSDAAGSVTITASLRGNEASSTDSVDIGLEPAPPSALSLIAVPAQITPNDKKTTLTARLLDASGSPARGKNTIEFRTAEGPIRNPKSLGKGVFSADIPVTWNVRTRAQAIAAVRGNRQAVRQIVALPLSDWVMTGQKVPITVLSLDQYGNPVADVAINCSVRGGGGSVTGSVQTDARGLGTVVYTAGQLAGLGAVHFVSGDASYTAPIWQSPDPMKKFEFPVSGGQRQGRTLAKWKKLRAVVDLGQAPEAVVAAIEPTVGGAWGAQTTPQVGTDSGSVASAGPPAAIQVSIIPGSVPETGGVVNILVKVVDASGILAPGYSVILIADGGKITGKTDNGDGTFSAVLTVGPDIGKTSIQVTATRPEGDVAGFASVQIGEAVATTPIKIRKPRGPKGPKASAVTPGDSSDRMKHRWGEAWVGWAPGGYTYDANPCLTGDDPCVAPPEADLDEYEFLQVKIRGADGESPIAVPASFTLGGEIYPGGDWIAGMLSFGARAQFTRLSYTTDFGGDTGEGDSFCENNFCDQMSFFTVDFQLRLALLREHGPLDIVLRPIGYSFQDVVLFRQLYDPADSPEDRTRKPGWATIGLHSVRSGIGVRYTVIPLLRPHMDYNITWAGGGVLNGFSFSVNGVTNHNLVVGLSAFPFKGLLVDASYDLTTRAMSLGEEQVEQYGELREAAHTLRLTAGWGF